MEKLHPFEQNIYDTVKEWEIKIGYRPEPISLYYPEESLLELLGVSKAELPEKIKAFQEQVRERLGAIEIASTKEEGRYCVTVPAKGTAYIHEQAPENRFLKAFLEVITSPGKKLEDIEQVFYRFSKDVKKEKQEEREWGFWFADENIDPYVYYVEEDAFGLEYHRFTKNAYKKLFS